jgi:hypothetical protein
MDHRYIDEQSVAERYLGHELKPQERAAFEAHLVDCTECMDRLMLAGMFHARNGMVPFRARFVAQFTPWQLAMMLLGAAVFLLAIPTAYFLWQLHLK